MVTVKVPYPKLSKIKGNPMHPVYNELPLPDMSPRITRDGLVAHWHLIVQARYTTVQCRTDYLLCNRE